MRKRRILITLLFFVVVVLAVGGFVVTQPSDLRTVTVREGGGEARARQLLNEMGLAHGIDQWKNVAAYTALFEDEFFGMLGKNSAPFPQENTQFTLEYIPGTFDGRLSFVNGELKGTTWGVQSWQTYTETDGGAPQLLEDDNITFWVPTYQYFIEFPLRIQQATAVAYAGEKVINGTPCVGVLASWGQVAPQKDIDQYLIWLDASSKRIVKLEYTIREMMGFLTGAAHYTEYRDFDGLILATKYPVESNLVREGFLHEMRLLDFHANAVNPDVVRPLRDVATMGDKKR